MNNIKTVKASHLMKGDVLASGFVVSNNAWRGVRTPSSKVIVEGRYPGQEVNTRREWNRNTTVQVVVGL